MNYPSLSLSLIGCVVVITVGLITIVISTTKEKEPFVPITLVHVQPRYETVLEPEHPGRHAPELLPVRHKERLMPLAESRLVVSARSRAVHDPDHRMVMTHALQPAPKGMSLVSVVVDPLVTYRCVLLCKEAMLGSHLSDFVGETEDKKEKKKKQLVVAVSSEIESKAFGHVWAIAGGGDILPNDPRVIVVDAQKAANGACDLVVVWACPDSLDLVGGIRTARTKCAGKGTSILCMAYDPYDNARATGDEMRWGPAIAHSRAPALHMDNADVTKLAADVTTATSGASIMAFLSSPTLIMTASEGAGAKMVDAVASVLLKRNREEGAWVTYYESIDYANIYPLSNEIIRQMTQHRIKVLTQSPYAIPEVDILDQFTPEPGPQHEPVTVIPTQDIGAVFSYQHDGLQRVCTFRESAHITGIDIKKGDRLQLTRQLVHDQNGYYVAVSSTELHSPLLLVGNSIGTRMQARGDWLVEIAMPKDFDMVLVRPGDRVLWQSTYIMHATVLRVHPPSGSVKPPSGSVKPPSGSVTLIVAQAEMNRSSMTPQVAKYKKDWIHSLSRCMLRRNGRRPQPKQPEPEAQEKRVTQRSARTNRMWSPFTRKMCDDLGDEAVWDRPCEHDSDCPYYQVQYDRTSGQTVYRGGCLESGYCELPVGVSGIGYTKVDAASPKPMCRCLGDATNKASQACCSEHAEHAEWVFELR